MRSISSLGRFPNVAFETVLMFVRLTMALSRPFKEDCLSLLLFTPLASRRLMMSLALCPQVLSQAPQHFRSSKKQAICESFFARQCICSVLSLHSRLCGVSESDVAGNVYNWYSNYLSDVSASAGPCIVKGNGFLCHQAFLRARQESVEENEKQQSQSTTDLVICRRLLQI